jgi:hypothetical protein
MNTLVLLKNRLLVSLIAIATTFVIPCAVMAQPRQPLPQMVKGAKPLPILPALPTREAWSFYADLKVQHGFIEQAMYKDVAGNEKRMHVYLPPRYLQSGKSYPVLYLNHGGGDDDSRWSC